jgi:hypothetical protein
VSRVDFGAEIIRAKIIEHYRHAGVHEKAAVEPYYHEDAILDFPQGSERIRGREGILAMRSAFPGEVRVVPRRVIGEGDLWVHEGTITYDGQPKLTTAIIELRDGKVARETIYVYEGWDPPPWRARWVEPMGNGDPTT